MKAEQTTFNQIILPPGFVYGPILDQMANGFKANLGFYSKRLVLCPFPPHSLILKKNEAIDFLSVSHTAWNIKIDSEISQTAVSPFSAVLMLSCSRNGC